MNTSDCMKNCYEYLRNNRPKNRWIFKLYQDFTLNRIFFMADKTNRNTINSDLSLKFSQLNFLLSFLVVFIHSYTYYYNVNDAQWVFQKIVSDNIGRIAVPLFFSISGFFLFLKYENSWEDYKELISKKMRSLVIPYFLWSLLSCILMFCIQLVYTDLNQELMKNKTIFENIKSFLTGEYTVLWFVRILFFMMLLTPVLKFIIDRKYLYIPVLMILFFLDFLDNNFSFFILKSDSLLFFMLGGVLSQNLSLFDKKINSAVLLIISVLFAGANIYMDWGTTNHVNDVNIFERLFILSFSIFVWNCDAIYKFLNRIPAKNYHYAFTIYIFHAYIVVMIFKKISSALIPLPAVAYLLTAFGTFFFCLLLSILLEKYLPFFFRILSGDRKVRKTVK